MWQPTSQPSPLRMVAYESLKFTPPSRAARARPRPSRGSRTRAAPGGWWKSSGRRRARLDWPSLLGIMNDALRAEVAELADAHDSGSCARKGVGVRVPPSAPLVTRHDLRS